MVRYRTPEPNPRIHVCASRRFAPLRGGGKHSGHAESILNGRIIPRRIARRVSHVHDGATPALISRSLWAKTPCSSRSSACDDRLFSVVRRWPCLFSLTVACVVIVFLVGVRKPTHEIPPARPDTHSPTQPNPTQPDPAILSKHIHSNGITQPGREKGF